MNIYEKLTAIQNALKAPKDAENKFGNYKYRTIDGINEALKPLLESYKASVTLTDELILIGDRYYIKATATLRDSENIVLVDKDGNIQPMIGEPLVDQVESVAYAREPENKKGSDESQITGAAATYARKYALTGLFLLDNSADDPDTTNKGETTTAPKKTTAKKTAPAQAQSYICAKCGAQVDKEFAEAVTAALGKCYCRDCNAKRNEAIKKKRAEEEAKKNISDAELPFPI